MKPTPRRPTKKRHQGHSAPSKLADAVEAILRKGTVVESFVRYSPLDVELATTNGWYRIQGLDEHRGRQPLGTGKDALDERFLARQAELKGMDRAGLKAELKKIDPTFKVLKRYSDDDLRNVILIAQFAGERRGG